MPLDAHETRRDAACSAHPSFITDVKDHFGPSLLLTSLLTGSERSRALGYLPQLLSPAEKPAAHTLALVSVPGLLVFLLWIISCVCLSRLKDAQIAGETLLITTKEPFSQYRKASSEQLRGQIKWQSRRGSPLFLLDWGVSLFLPELLCLRLSELVKYQLSWYF